MCFTANLNDIGLMKLLVQFMNFLRPLKTKLKLFFY